MLSVAPEQFISDYHAILGMEPYKQYSRDEVINQIFIETKKYFFTQYAQKLAEGINQQTWWYEGDNEYLQYYIESLFGLLRSFGTAIVNNQYDTGIQYDKSLKYDDTTFNGFMGLPYYKKLVKHFLDYNSNTFNLIWLFSLVADFCDDGDFTFTQDVPNNTVTVNIKDSTESRLLARVFQNRSIYTNIPLTNIIFNLT